VQGLRGGLPDGDGIEIKTVCRDRQGWCKRSCLRIVTGATGKKERHTDEAGNGGVAANCGSR
jgi:hypothetical protein